ncbi:MAG: TetR/AcrR family transcriptional regulator [Verrucomicrobiota bacterium]
MGRRKDHTREELTRIAINAGTELVVAEGPEALTARNVAKLIGYTPGTLYNLFENIDELCTAINIKTLNRFAVEIEQILNEHSKSKKRLRRICQAYLNFHQKKPELWALCFATPLRSLNEDYHQAVHKVFDPVAEALLPISGDPQAARQDAKVLWSTLHGICLLQQTGKLNVAETDPAEILVKRFLDQFLKR